MNSRILFCILLRTFFPSVQTTTQGFTSFCGTFSFGTILRRLCIREAASPKTEVLYALYVGSSLWCISGWHSLAAFCAQFVQSHRNAQAPFKMTKCTTTEAQVRQRRPWSMLTCPSRSVKPVQRQQCTCLEQRRDSRGIVSQQERSQVL